MPIAFTATFFPMRIHGFSLNLMTSLALALSMGVLVGNAILILENIFYLKSAINFIYHNI
jgi:HAE1 family hydrophobic/amphiphilic exporter-1